MANYEELISAVATRFYVTQEEVNHKIPYMIKICGFFNDKILGGFLKRWLKADDIDDAYQVIYDQILDECASKYETYSNKLTNLFISSMEDSNSDIAATEADIDDYMEQGILGESAEYD